MRDRQLIVTDVDNTLYDWVALWAGAFDALVRTLAHRTEVDRDVWLEAARAIHVQRRSTECPSLLADLAASAVWPAQVDTAHVAAAAASAYRKYWDDHLALYAGVREALADLVALGHRVVAYTEGDVSIAAARMARMGLGGIIVRVFGRAPLAHATHSSWCLVETTHDCSVGVDIIPSDASKPSPAGLLSIMARFNVAPQHTLYVGDNLFKDVGMAHAAGARAGWARYGTSRHPANASLLERVAHWSAQDTHVERSFTEHTIAPDLVLDDPRALLRAVEQRVPAAH